MLFVILEIALALAIVGLIVFWIARPPPKITVGFGGGNLAFHII